MSANKLSGRMRNFDKQMRPEFETSFIAGWADEVATLEQRAERLEHLLAQVLYRGGTHYAMLDKRIKEALAAEEEA